MLVENVILSFPQVFAPKKVNNTGDPKYSAQFLIRPDHPQLATVQAEFNRIKADAFPSGMPAKADACFQAYDIKLAGKEYYDARFSGWYILSGNSKQDNRPTVVNMALEDVIDPAEVFSGALVDVNLNMYAYLVGDMGIAGGLNGIRLRGEVGPMGRLDNKPTKEQMFSQQQAPAQTAASNGAAPPPRKGPPPVPPKKAPGKIMTAKAAGATYESFIAAGWDDQAMIDEGYMIASSV